MAPSQVQFYHLSCLFYLKRSTCACILFLPINDWLTARPVQKLKRARSLGNRGLEFCWICFSRGGDLFECWKLQESGRRKRKFQGRSLRQGPSNFYFIQLAEAISIFPFLYSVALRLYPQMNAQSLGSRKKESARDSGSKRGLYIILRVTLLLAPHSLVLSLFLLASDCYDCLSPQEAHNAQLQNTRKACGTA